ncbi:pyridoxamine 5'-phosphate oxidase family protein [Spirillospora sp. CA-294931]|uniref:pyridoxamine 5'-phosphate oxidase family protein n=1 Tax=Spirillospora sp. CA-294931 TaxID=3240042 RepID=UPI003D8D2B59
MQTRAGLVRQADHGSQMIRADIPAVAADFVAQQPMIVVGAADGDGRLWATLLTGRPGFVRASGTGTVEIAARPRPSDPLAAALGGPARVGMIAIDPARRRRMRVNGRAQPVDGGLRVVPDQVYANCPKYIQKRHVLEIVDGPPGGAAVTGSVLEPGQIERITAADTLFVATSDDVGNTDASHRGGNPGFVEVLSPTRLRWPDYPGNAMFMTLGNLELNPAAGLLFPDFATGTTLQLSGTARTDWSSGERHVDFTVTRVVETPGAVPLRWSDPEYSRFNPTV